ncbi:TIGR01440 family protein [Kurthia gibsonii]|uniref:TIGR01440 family protein n=1 Tax=Kurthia gibsonii TaxID=33946 RepID=UPI002DB57639|nr:TIGR01440 family protein [Kurthia gibsonii]MEB6112970.1 TIGR01440 family protein [Kurthia gibsonii]
MLDTISQDLTILLNELAEQTTFKKGQLFVVGCSTSEVKGAKIGTAGGLEIAEALYQPLEQFAKQHGLYLVFQGCEHINRVLTMEREAAERYQLEEVAVIPVVKAGGSMSAYAYRHLQDPVVVETVQAHAGIDIGQTLIGMHLKRVAVPVRTSVQRIGEAVVTVAKTRLKLVGGERAVYTLD